MEQIHLAKNGEQQTAYYHCDQIGAPRELTNERGELCWYASYKGWRELQGEHNLKGVHQPIRLQNQYADRETGLHYNFFRYYEPTIGRFTTQDPIGLEGGENFYVFAKNTQKYKDPLGLHPLAIPACSALQQAATATIGFLSGVFIADAVLSETESEAEERQKEYEVAKRFCDTPPPPGNNKCSTLSKQIDHAEICMDLYQKWDEKWLSGRHDKKIESWKNRLNNLKKEAKKNCG